LALILAAFHVLLASSLTQQFHFYVNLVLYNAQPVKSQPKSVSTHHRATQVTFTFHPTAVVLQSVLTVFMPIQSQKYAQNAILVVLSAKEEL
jgi:hypothetical protein